MKHYLLLLIITLGLLASCTAPVRPASAPSAYLPGSYDQQISVDGRQRSYRLHVPPGYRAGTALPLVVNLHYMGGQGADQERVTAMSALADQAGFLVVYPDGLGDPAAWPIWEPSGNTAEVRFIRELVLYLRGQLSIDSQRIYATGLSNGAMLADRLGCELADLFAAIGPVAGGYLRSLSCVPARPVSVIAMHGTDDRTLPYQGSAEMLPVSQWASMWAIRNGCSATPEQFLQRGEVSGQRWGGCQAGVEVVLYTISGRGHNWPASAYPPPDAPTTQELHATEVIWEFFRSHPQQ